MNQRELAARRSNRQECKYTEIGAQLVEESVEVLFVVGLDYWPGMVALNVSRFFNYRIARASVSAVQRVKTRTHNGRISGRNTYI